MDPNPKTGVFTRREKFRHTNREDAMLCEVKAMIGVTYLLAKECQGMPATTKN